MRVLLLNPPFLPRFSRPQRSPAVTKSGTLYYPLFLAQTASLLLSEGLEVLLLDAPARGYDLGEVIRRAREFRPQLVVVDTSTPSIHSDVGVATQLREALGVFVLLVGTHASALPEVTLRMDERLTAVARGEYEFTALELARALEGGRVEDLGGIAGLSWRRDGQIVHNPPRSPLEDLDRLPFVSEAYRRFLRIEDYFNPNALWPMVTIIAGRGCPHGCTFCVYPQTITGRRYRLRSPEHVMEEMAYIVEAFPQARSVFFEDDTLGADPERCLRLCELIRRRGIRISWTANARVDMDRSLLGAMKGAGCRCLCVGFESGSQELLDRVRKGITLEQMFSFMEEARRVGLRVHGCFMVGLPGETRQTMEQTLRLAKRLNPDTAQFYPMMVYPGTEAYEEYRRRGMLTTEDFRQWLTPEGLHNTVIRTSELDPRELVAFCDRARREFYLRPRWLIRKALDVIRDPRGEGVRVLKAFRTFWRYLWRGSFGGRG